MYIVRRLVRGAAFLAAALLWGACTDLPSGPGDMPGAVYSDDCYPRGDGTYVCPVIPIWGECDPYHFDCGEDDCINSAPPGDATTQGCNGGGSGGGGAGGDGGGDDDFGGGGGGGDGGGGPPACPDYGCEEPPPSQDDDYIDADTIPDCTQPQFEDWKHAYCTSAPPTGERLLRTQNSLQRIQARGGECANIAAAGWQLLASNALRYFPHVESIHGEYIGWGSRAWGAILAEQWVDTFGGDPLGYPNFDTKLVHEIEHAMGRGHVDGERQNTPNSVACAGLQG